MAWRSCPCTPLSASRYSASSKGLYTPTCRTAGARAPVSRLRATKPSITTPKPADSRCVALASPYIGWSRCRASTATRNSRLTTHAPSALPTARLGAPTRLTALMPEASSGKEVTVASSATPTQPRPQP